MQLSINNIYFTRMFWAAFLALVGWYALPSRDHPRALVTIETLESDKLCGNVIWQKTGPVTVSILLTKTYGYIQLPNWWEQTIETEWGVAFNELIDVNPWYGGGTTLKPSIILASRNPPIELGRPYRWCFSGFGSLVRGSHWMEVFTDTTGAVVMGKTQLFVQQ